MLRTVLSIVACVMVASPRRVVEVAERAAFENPEDAVLRGWTIPIARLEGLGWLLLIRRTGFISGTVGVMFGLIGSFAAAAPSRYLDFGLSLAYENPDDITVRSWVLPMTRVLGITALGVAVASLRDSGDE
jgi:hypothetical protein